MTPIYLDNAATTPLDPQVLDAMLPYLKQHFGNPSSVHAHGREVRAAIEQARKQLAEHFNCSPGEIFFTSGGTEADNTALIGAVEQQGIRHVLTSPLEHHAVLHPLEYLAKQGRIELEFVQFDQRGVIDLNHLENWLAQHPKALVSLMYGNNEVGNLNPIPQIGELCHQYGALLHSDTVQAVGHYPLDLQELPVDFIAGSAHKFHGPKGVGFFYVRDANTLPPYIHGGAQERNMRGGTENVASIIGLAKALELAEAEMDEHRQHILGLKQRLIDKLKAGIDDLDFNGLSGQLDQSLYTVLNVSLPASEINEMLLFNLDIKQISASAGSACTSGSDAGSHVLSALGCDPARGAVRFSFSKLNTREEIDQAADVLCQMYGELEGNA